MKTFSAQQGVQPLTSEHSSHHKHCLLHLRNAFAIVTFAATEGDLADTLVWSLQQYLTSGYSILVKLHNPALE